jgi:hypothetical protein
MKKPLPKLVLHRETLRMLTNLDLTRAVGGLDSVDNQYLDVYQTGAKQCEALAVVIATANCR